MITMGIIGCSNVSKNSIIPFTDNSKIRLLAIASRDLDKAKTFSKQFTIPHYFSSYEEMLESPLVNSIYIALPPAIQTQYIIHALKNKKNVIVEKPACLTLFSFKQIEEAYNIGKGYLLEGLMVKHHPWQSVIRNMILGEKHGQLKRIETNICMQISDHMRNGYRMDKRLGGGVLLDEVPYWLQFLQACMSLEFEDCSIEVLQKEKDVDTTTQINASIRNVEVELLCSYDRPYDATHILHFQNATVFVKNFFRASLGKYKINIIEQTASGKSMITFEPANYYENQLIHFIKMVDNVYSDNDVLQQLEEIRQRTKWLEYFWSEINNA